MGRDDNARIGDLLVSAGLVKRDDVEQAAEAAEAEGRRLTEELIDRGLVHEREVFQHLSAQRDLPFADADALFDDLDADAADRLPRERQDALGALPFCERDGRLRVAVSDLTLGTETLARELGCDTDAVDAVMVTPTDLRRLQWALDLGPQGARADGVERGSPGPPELLQDDAREQSDSVALFDAVLTEAVAQQASDVHVEPGPSGGRVRLRVDGELRDCDHLELDGERLRGLVSVIKIRSQLDITEHRRPQEGRFSMRFAGRHFDVRVQTQPSLHGQSAVLRMLSPERNLLSVDRLGFSETLQQDYLRLLESPSGLVLVAGPSGSGKTTTLYAGLQVLAEDATRKVISVEDPIEYAVSGVLQTQADPEHDFGFSQAVRTFVREDPDVILVGEIRDPETALEALRASQTGHLVLASIHANDTVDAVQRLFDLGMHPNSIAAELLAVLGQRLARRICPACRVPHQPDRSLLRDVFPEGAPEDLRVFRGEGCESCRGFGIRERTAVAELLPSTRELRRAVVRHAPLDDLRQAALRSGLHTLRDHAIALAREGVIALEELPRLFQAEMLAGWNAPASASG